jgi:hypothetical protein
VPRKALPALAVVLVLAVTATDWPLGWSFWVDHPLVAAVAGGIALLVLAGTALDAYVAHRERSRWYLIPWAASSDFALVFEDAWLAMVRLLGVDAQFEPFMQTFTADGHRRAVELCGREGFRWYESALMIGEPPDLPETFMRPRLSVLTADQVWLDSAFLAVRMILRRHSDAVSRWAGTTTLLRDEAFMQAVSGSIPTIDKLVVVMNLLDLPDDESRAKLVDSWIELHRAFRHENAVWLKRVYRDASDARQALVETEVWLAGEA